MKQCEQQRLNNNWAKAKELWEQKKKHYKLHGWTLRAAEMVDKVGLCDYNRKTITISTVFMRASNCNYKKVDETLSHEVAHALTPGHQHGTVWKKKCRELGGDCRLTTTVIVNGPCRSRRY